MGIYIKGARMPNCCLECMLYNGYGCKATMQMFHPITNVGVRVDSCPLVEVEVPHGRLIDIEKALANCESIFEIRLDSKSAPTVIEAEVEHGSNTNTIQSR